MLVRSAKIATTCEKPNWETERTSTVSQPPVWATAIRRIVEVLVQWGDGEEDLVTDGFANIDLMHDYAASGQYTVTLSKASSTDTTIAYTVTGTATSGDDFTPLSGSVTITAGNTTATIDLAALDDALVEASETVIVTLDSISSGDPQITIDGRWIGGFTELTELHMEEKLDHLVEGVTLGHASAVLAASCFLGIISSTRYSRLPAKKKLA